MATSLETLAYHSLRILTGDWQPTNSEKAEFIEELKVKLATTPATPIWRVELATKAFMRGVMYIQAKDEKTAETLAMDSLGDVSWEYEGTCEGEEDGPSIVSITGS